MKLEQKAEILMKYFRENMSRRAIAKEMKVSRTTVRKYIKDYESKYEEIDFLFQKSCPFSVNMKPSETLVNRTISKILFFVSLPRTPRALRVQ